MTLQPIEKSLNNIPKWQCDLDHDSHGPKDEQGSWEGHPHHPVRCLLCLASQALEEDGGITVPVCKHSSLSILLGSCCLSYPLQKGVKCFVQRGEELQHHVHISVAASEPQHWMHQHSAWALECFR